MFFLAAAAAAACNNILASRTARPSDVCNVGTSVVKAAAARSSARRAGQAFHYILNSAEFPAETPAAAAARTSSSPLPSVSAAGGVGARWGGREGRLECLISAGQTIPR